MAESPWVSSTPPPAPPVPTGPAKPPNWGFYLLISVVLGLGVGLLVGLIAQVTGLPIPDALVNIAVLIAAVSISGGRYLKSNGGTWTREDRKRLGLSYTMVSAVITLLALGVIAAAVAAGAGPELGVDLELLREIPMIVAGLLISLIVALALLINYGITRWTLWAIVNKQARKPADISNEFS